MPEDRKVVPLPLTRAQATERVREIAKDSRRWAITMPYGKKEAWRRAVNQRQVDLCLREGYVLDEHARLDEHGHWRFRIARVCAGLDIEIDVALEREGASPRLFVVGIRGDRI